MNTRFYCQDLLKKFIIHLYELTFLLWLIFQAEIARGETANSISCYMYETGASEAEARKHIEKLIQKAWRNMNKCQIDNETPFARSFAGTAINLARIAHCTYQHGDGHGAPDSRSKNRISSLIIEPMSFH